MKERILSEIRRLAAENGGKAPGQRFFEQETGIKRGQWRGKLWIAWSDAIAEAGLAPNEVTAELDAGRVLDCFEEACRHFQRPPTWAEWQFFARQQTDFVGVHSFRRVFGDAFGAVVALRERAVERGDTELLSILPEAAASPTTNDLAASFVGAEGWVYLLQSGVHFKVGRSDELEKRVKQISIALPERVVMVHAIRTDDPPGIEAYWHRRFASRRANGEWFKLSPDDLKAFKRRKFQ
ncbi:GIY-YIG nuclease family protein [Acidimangrovimonas sediminis]|uniref:GIY-YIG nuclease family protein n=2 Tax=Albidovulum sediminis TaxID=3066345 RepID=A0ABT2NJM5_9RHOB|nr:GIY-YIG nuclease family protein [Defluviimonas sediminis]